MIFKNRKVTHTNGDVELKLSLRFSADELAGMESINEDHNATIDGLRIEGTMWQKVAHYFCFLRVLIHLADLWDNRQSIPDVIAQHKGRKQYREHQRANTKKRRRKRK